MTINWSLFCGKFHLLSFFSSCFIHQFYDFIYAGFCLWREKRVHSWWLKQHTKVTLDKVEGRVKPRVKPRVRLFSRRLQEAKQLWIITLTVVTFHFPRAPQNARSNHSWVKRPIKAVTKSLTNHLNASINFMYALNTYRKSMLICVETYEKHIKLSTTFDGIRKRLKLCTFVNYFSLFFQAPPLKKLIFHRYSWGLYNFNWRGKITWQSRNYLYFGFNLLPPLNIVLNSKRTNKFLWALMAHYALMKLRLRGLN